jgi:hypothetical protein
MAKEYQSVEEADKAYYKLLSSGGYELNSFTDPTHVVNNLLGKKE